MALDTAADIDSALQEAGVPVATACASTYALFDESAELMPVTDGAGLQRLATQLVIRTGTLPDLATDRPIQVKGAPHIVRWFGPLDDGALTSVLVTKETGR